MSEITVRRATPADARTLASLLEEVWPGERVDIDLVRGVLGERSHVTLLAEVRREGAGLVDCFMTRSPGGTRRWEIDLLAVRGSHRRSGIGHRLVHDATDEGRRQGAGIARALIAVENIASQRTFGREGFRQEDGTSLLFLADPLAERHITSPDEENLPLTPVRTLRYQGLWVEPPWSLAQLQGARSRDRLREGEIAGAVIPLQDADGLARAERAGYREGGRYTWWMLKFS